MDEQVRRFLDGEVFAVAGASTDRAKFGNRVLRCYQTHGLTVHPINPRAETIESLRAFESVAALPEPVHGLSIVTPPPVTTAIVRDAIELGIEHIWIQPGAESDEAVEQCDRAGVNLISGGPCLLVELGEAG